VTVGLLAACGGKPGTPIKEGEELSIGKANAPITLVEYASVACPVCAQWNNEVLPKFKAKYIDSGQVRLVSREMNAHNPAFSTAGFLLARCAGKEKYFDVVDDIYRQQTDIEQSGDFNGGLERIGKKHGVSAARMRQCVTDPVAIAAQNERVAKHAMEDNVNSTPTFMINGEVVATGFIGMPDLDTIIAAAKAKGAAPITATEPVTTTPPPAK
jgi:protein-disulfide isomerase